jgi:uncharacterized membrane protein
MGLNILINLAIAAGALLGGLAFFRILALEQALAFLRDEVKRINAGAKASAPTATVPDVAEPKPAMNPTPPAAQSEPEPAGPILATAAEPAADSRPAETETVFDLPPPETMGPDLVNTVIKTLTKNWLVWLGGLALVFGGAFLLKSAIDAGLFGPPIRTLAALIAGGAMIAAAEWTAKMRDNADEGDAVPAALRDSAAPPALAGAGGATIYGAIYAAYGLYGLIPSVVAFALLAAACAGATALAMRHRAPGLGVLALVGAYATPALTASGEPNASALFTYVLGVCAAGFWVARLTNMRIVTYVAAAGALGWPLLYILASGRFDLSFYIYLPSFAALAGAFAWRDAHHPYNLDISDQKDWSGLSAPLAALPYCLAGAVILAIVATARAPASGESLALWASLSLLAFFGASRRPAFAIAPPVAAIGVILAVALAGQVSAIADIRAILAFAALFSAGGFAAMRGVSEKALIACAAGLTPGALIAMRHWLGVDELQWMLIFAALAVAAANVAMIGAIARREGGFDRNPGAMSALVVGASFAVALAAVISLDGMFLSVALTAQAPALALLWRRFKLPALKYCAAALGVFSSARLLLLPEVFDYAVGPLPVLNLLLLAYLAPSAAFWFAARIFEQGGLARAARIIQSLEGGAIALFAAFVSLEIRHAMNGGDLGAMRFSLAETSLQAISWVSIAAFMRWRFGADLTRVRRVAEIALTAAAAGLTALNAMLIANPWWGVSPIRIPGPPIVNMLLLYYLAPALAFAAAAFTARRGGAVFQSRLAGGFAALLGATWVTLVVRQAFHAVDLTRGAFGLTESAILATTWTLAGAIVAFRFMNPHRPVVNASIRALLGAAAAVMILFPLIALNPWWGTDASDIGGPPLVNALLLDFLAPALAFAAAAFALRRFAKRVAHLSAYFAAALGLVWLILVVRHVFHAPTLNLARVDVAESWSYSAVIILYAAALLIAGVRRGGAVVSAAGFGALMLAAVKVFVFDMAGLEGVWRASAFLGLGAALIGIAFLYQRTAIASKNASDR